MGAAFSHDADLSFQSSPYIGGALGYTQMKSKVQESMESVLFARNSSESNNKTNHSMGGDLFMGYRHIFDNGVLTGIDLAIAWDGNKGEHVSTQLSGLFLTHTRFSTPYKLIPGVVVGTRFSERYLAFVKIGVSMTQFRVNHKLETIGFNVPPRISSFRKSKTGFFGSAGFEYALTKNLSGVAMVSYDLDPFALMNFID